MKVMYDAEGDVLYIEFRDTTVTTQRVDSSFAIDYDADGRIAGIEILDASKKVAFEDTVVTFDLNGLLSRALLVGS